jgi:hypothetical protein
MLVDFKQIPTNNFLPRLFYNVIKAHAVFEFESGSGISSVHVSECFSGSNGQNGLDKDLFINRVRVRVQEGFRKYFIFVQKNVNVVGIHA